MQSFFVSSTFKDMQGERDVLHRTVMPRLREQAAKNGENIQFIDLRWGISTADMDSDDSTSKILGVCLQEVKNCKPYMIVLLGERYGWIPPAHQIMAASEQVDFTPNDTQISVTELEIRYGMYLAGDQLERCIFCLREPVTGDLTPEQKEVYLAASDEDARRMAALRKKIKDTPGARVISYRLSYADGQFAGYEDFSEKLYRALEDLMAPRWAERSSLTWQQRQQEDNAITAENHLSSFVERKAVLEKLSFAIGSSQIVTLEGEGGCGKSALMAKLNELLRSDGQQTALFFCGNSINCMRTEQLMQLILWHLDRAEEKTPADVRQEQLREYYRKRLQNYQGPAITLFVDAIDQLTPDQDLFESRFIPPSLSENIRMVISTTGAVRVNPTALTGFASQRIRLEPPEREELRAILNARFAAEHKQVSKQVADKLLDNPCSQNMLGMEIMVRRLVMLGEKDFAQIAMLEQTMDGASAIDTYLIQLIEKFDTILPLLISSYFHEVSCFLTPEDYGISELPLYIISMLQHGISAPELESISEMIHTDKAYANLASDSIWRCFWSPVFFSRLKRYMGGLLAERSDGRVDFSHRLLRKALRGNDTCVTISPFLRDWLLSLPQENTCRLENILPVGRMAEQWAYCTSNSDQFQGSLIRECFQSPTAHAGRLRNADDPEGDRQLDVLQRSVVEDITEGYASLTLDYYCLILRSMIRDDSGPNSYPVWFFGERVVRALTGLGQNEKRYGLRILSCILEALHSRKDCPAVKQWTASHKLRFLLYHRYALDIFSELTEAFRLGNIKLEYYEGMSAEVIFTKGCALADEYIREEPENPSFLLHKAALCASYAKKITLPASWGLKESPHESLCASALDCIEQAFALPVKTKHREDALRTGAICLETIYTNAFGRVFGKGDALRAGDKMAQRIWELTVPDGNADDLQVEHVARFKRAWSRCLNEKSEWTFGKRQEKHQNQALDLCLDYYYAVSQNQHRKLNDADRRSLGQLGVQAALLLLEGGKPALAAEKGVTAEQCLGYLAKLEASYFQAEARRDFQSRWCWAIMLCAEIIDAQLSDAHRLRNAELAVSILAELLKTVKDKGQFLDVRESQIEHCLSFAKRYIAIKAQG